MAVIVTEFPVTPGTGVHEPGATAGEDSSAKPAASAGELGRVLSVSASDIRHHLSILLDQASITIIGQRPAFGRGRPARLYALTQPASPNNLEVLADSLLTELLAGVPLENQPAVLRRLRTLEQAGRVHARHVRAGRVDRDRQNHDGPGGPQEKAGLLQAIE